MAWLSTPTLTRLRDQLQAHGQRPSVVIPSQNLSPDALEFVQVPAQYGTLCEAMYIMMAADGRVTQDERDVLKGALRSLSGDTVRGVHIEAMLDAAAKKLAAEGRPGRMAAIVDELRADTTLAEVAFVLMAAIAFADNVIEDEENEVLNELADGLGLSAERANELLDQVDQERG
ncbi:MAG: TerB family tellurite resistance protein [Myxococcota bacterium]